MPKFSTGLRDAMLNASGFKSVMDGSELRIFSITSPETVPATADAEQTGELLMTLSADGTGGVLNFGLPEGGVISKSDTEVWMTSAVDVSGQCAYFRLVRTSDLGDASNIARRVQGTCGLVGTDMVLTNTTVVAGVPWTLNFFSVALPTL